VFEFRTILAIASFACGALLLIVGVLRFHAHRRSRTRRSDLLTISYGVLFGIVGLIILFRSDHAATEREFAPQVMREAKPEQEMMHQSPATSLDSTQVETGVSESSRADVDMGASRQLKTQSVPPVDHADNGAVAMRRKLVQRPQQIASEVKEPAEVIHRLSPGDRVFLTVSSAFDAIEKWFMEHGYPNTRGDEFADSHAPTLNQLRRHQIRFPNIEFESGTAELMPQSLGALKELAASLNALSSSVSIEIQASVDSLGPEPYNHILTQARAEVVRDVLVQEGVDTRRIVANAKGSQGDDSTNMSGQINFVLRP